ncbi:hypothetical protein BEP19_03430 [Ammoniphilus oxalaticus]|uniref:DUF1189 domain-containing protein n=1 Tax=Ammoniphilus oxalaticus TaxID=66863 RepID=A0A419SNV7_9BACL|nr:DUF1189 domain-containing protein [Ammoniphilus oxalaticus]RKD25990.1 hypothetical protein BEP19_03430 [Ammoniphilus oxalaticus]
MGFFQQVKFSIVNIKKYEQLSTQRFSKIFLYLVILSIIAWFLSFASLYQTLNKEIKIFKEQIPDFTFHEGHLEVAGPMPIILHKDLTSIVMVDTSGSTQKEHLNSFRSGALILSDRVINKESEHRFEEFHFSRFSSLSLTKDTVMSWLPYVNVIYLLLGVIIFLFTFFAYLVNAFWISLVGLLFRLILKVNITFSTIYKFSIYALTLPILLDRLLPYIGINLSGLVFYITAAVYIALALFEIDRMAKTADSGDGVYIE